MAKKMRVYYECDRCGAEIEGDPVNVSIGETIKKDLCDKCAVLLDKFFSNVEENENSVEEEVDPEDEDSEPVESFAMTDTMQRLIKEDEDEFVRLFRKGLTNKQIGMLTGMTYGQVIYRARAMKQLGIVRGCDREIEVPEESKPSAYSGMVVTVDNEGFVQDLREA